MAQIRDESELGRIDAVETARRIREGEVPARAVIEAAIARAERVEPHLNAIFTPDFDAALARATALDRAVAPGHGVFSGVPTFVKGLDDVAGLISDRGSRALRGRVARRTEAYVGTMLDTGLVSLGTSAAPEIGLNATTEPLAYGPTRNPWNPAHSTGGSSGGAGALVAAGVVPIAHASDAGGSIRIPASACGLVGLKPGRDRRMVSRDAALLPIAVFTYGVLTRSVRDTAHFTAAVEAGLRKSRRRRGAPAPIGLVEGPSRKRLRIGVFTELPAGGAVEEEIREATLEAGRSCKALGHEVQEIACPYAGQLIDDMWVYIGWIAWAAILGARLQRRDRVDPVGYEPWTRGLAAHARERWRDWLGVRRRLAASGEASARIYAEHAGGLDVLLCPTLAAPPPEIGVLAPDRLFGEVFPLEKHWMGFTPIQNATGEPAISLPLARSRSGLPIGVQFVAARGGETRLLALAYELEAAGAFRQLGGAGSPVNPGAEAS